MDVTFLFKLKDMEFEGRISRVLPTRSGTSSKGEWMTLPFVFEYYENGEQRWSDKVLLETFDRAVMGQIGRFVKRGADGKGIFENGCAVLTGEIRCKCGFSHSVREWEGKVYNEVRMYKFELVQQPVGNSTGTAAQVQPPMQPFPPVEQAQEDDDLPF